MRTPLTYYGGKQKLADPIVSLMPAHRLYLEPFCGGAAVLFRKPRAQRETINDLDGAVVAFWRALRDSPDELARLIELTPYSREEWARSTQGLDEDDLSDLERGRRLIVAIDQSYARCGDTWSPPSKLGDRPGRWQAGTWANVPDRLLAVVDRLRGVAIECVPALELIHRWDMEGSLIYCDPPYSGEHRLRGAGSYRGGKRGYRYDDEGGLWPQLLEALLGVEHASVLLSGYPNDQTSQLEDAGWQPVPLQARRHAANKPGAAGDHAPETVWLSPTVPNTSQLSLEAA